MTLQGGNRASFDGDEDEAGLCLSFLWEDWEMHDPMYYVVRAVSCWHTNKNKDE